jgi:hypothetical protein
MPFTFRKSWEIIPGVRVNLNRRSLSATFGKRRGGPHFTASTSGRRTTSLNLPGPLGYRKTTTRAGRRRAASAEEQRQEAQRADLRARKEAALARRQERKDARRARREARRSAQ